jgi:hypothetical protein
MPVTLNFHADDLFVISGRRAAQGAGAMTEALYERYFSAFDLTESGRPVLLPGVRLSRGAAPLLLTACARRAGD